ncbi:Galactonate dehydratase [Hyphomicrobiales bacterium]|nr:Galactonate dehydratase [Hyphomicrobiales bacterium]CAH1688769.1 Galactonate dehydratase [Hyphomicrobiales bacterium]
MSTDGPKPLTIQALQPHLIRVSPKTHWIIVELSLADGTTGWGEATLAGAEEAVLAEIAHANTLLAGLGFSGPAEIVSRLRLAHASLARTIVMRAVEQAALDALARRAGLPLAALLGGPERMTIPIYANINRGIADRSPAGFAARARDVVTSDGYRAVKIAPFDGLNWARTDHVAGQRLLAAGIARIEAVREAIGPETALLVDCHARLSPVMARQVLRAVEATSLFWFEEPLDEHAFDGETARALRSFANDRGVRIAGGEQLATMTEARDFLARGACDAILPDLRWTGLRSGLTILELAASSGVAVSLHNPVGPVLDRISLQMAAALPSFLILERQVRESPLFDEIGGGHDTVVDGAIAIDAVPGFGPPPDRQALGRHAVRDFARPASLAGIPGAGGDA